MKKILVVDDDVLLRDSVAATLEKRGYQLTEADNGETGYAAAEKLKPDLIVTDISMPRMTGVDMLKKIRKTDWGKEVPAIVLTVHDQDPDLVNQSIEIGKADFLSKIDISLEQVADLAAKKLT